MYPKPQHVIRRDQRILDLLAGGEACTKEICLKLGMRFPGDLEKVRSSLNYLELNRAVIKSVRPTAQTRHAYYSLPNGHGETP